ncbi:MAG: response regulator, partial [Chloroflexi bacterium]|nr:response regulator [Chloroflexota bacterium]
RKSRILVVDDDLDLLRIVTRTLELEGYEASPAAGGKFGLALFQEQKPDLVILDIMMPDIDGYQVLKQIREHSNVPVIILTAIKETDSVQKSFGLGADDYVIKPFCTHKLLALVKAKLKGASKKASGVC